MSALAEGCGLEDLANGDQACRLVRDLDADGRLAGNRCLYPERCGGECEREVVLQGGDALHLHTWSGLHLELSDGRPWVHPDDLGLDAKRPQRGFDDFDIALDLVSHSLAAGGDGVEKGDRRQLPLDLRLIVLRLGHDAEDGSGARLRPIPILVVIVIGRLGGLRRRVRLRLDLPRSRRGRDRRISKPDPRAGGRSRRLRLLGGLLRNCDQSLQPLALGIRGLAGVQDDLDDRPRTEVNRHDEPDHQTRHEQCHGAPPARDLDERAIDPVTEAAPRVLGHAEDPDQRQHGDQPGHEVERARSGCVRPQEVRAHSESERIRHEP